MIRVGGIYNGDVASVIKDGYYYIVDGAEDVKRIAKENGIELGSVKVWKGKQRVVFILVGDKYDVRPITKVQAEFWKMQRGDCFEV